MKPKMFKWMLNGYPPYWGTGIRVVRVAPDFHSLVVVMKARFYNRNYVGTHFGGSLYMMTDPFYMLMLIQILGPGYIVWDRRAGIDFVKPGRGELTARFDIDEARVREIIAQTVGGRKCLPEFTVDVKDAAGEVVCRVAKTLYVRQKAAG